MSIDFSPYVNLRIYDKDPGELYLSAIDLMQINVPQLSLRAGTIEDSLLQAFSYITTVAVNHINALPNRLAEGIFSFMGSQRRIGSFAQVSATFEALTYDGGTLEAETTLEYKYTLGGRTYREYYELLDSVEIEPVVPDLDADPPTPLPTTTAILFANKQGSSFPVPEGTVLSVLNSLTVSSSAVALDDFEQGTFPESDSEYLSRSATYLASLSNTLNNAKQVETFVISAFENVGRVKVYDLTDGESDRSETAADEPGYITVFVYGKDRFLGTQEKKTIYDALYQRMTAGLQVVVMDMDLITTTVNATVIINALFDALNVKTAVEQQIQTYLSPSGFPYENASIRYTSLLAQISSVPGVSYVPSLSFTASSTTASGTDLIFDDKGSLPTLSDANISIEVGIQ